MSSARELPPDVPLALIVYLDKPAGLPDESRILRDAFRVHFQRRSEMSRRSRRRAGRRPRRSRS